MVIKCKLSQKEEGAACLATVVTGAVSRLCRAAADTTGFLPSVAAGHECCAARSPRTEQQTIASLEIYLGHIIESLKGLNSAANNPEPQFETFHDL